MTHNQQYLNYSQWQKIYGEGFELWKKNRFDGCNTDTLTFIRWVTETSNPKKLYSFQQEALLRVIYHHEITPLSPILLTLATGTGKTLIVSSVISYLQILNQTDKFLIICPNTIVRERLRRDFEGNKIFGEFSLFPSSKSDLLKRLSCKILDGESLQKSLSELHTSNLIIGNIHQLYTSHASGHNKVKFLQDNTQCLCIFNDEAHNTKPQEYDYVLNLLKHVTNFRVDLTATPERADGKRPDAHEVMKYDVIDAYRDNVIKATAVYRPDIDQYEYLDFDNNESYNMLWHDKDNESQKFTAHQIDAEKLLERPSLQLVTDPAPLRGQLNLAKKRFDEKIQLAGNKFKPVMFVVTASVADAEQTAKVMKSEFGLNPFVIYGDKDDDKTEMRNVAATLGSSECPYDSVVSVLMLREGWDVQEVSVIVLLRPFCSALYARQIVGRGLRRIRKPGISADQKQELDIIDHEALGLMWLWEEMDATVYKGSDIIRTPGDFPTSNPPPIAPDFGTPDIVRKDLHELLLPVPGPVETKFSAEEIITILKKILEQQLDFKCENIMIVAQYEHGWSVRRQNGRVDKFEEYRVVRAMPPEYPPDKIRDEFKQSLVALVENISKEFFEIEDHSQLIYTSILTHFTKKYFEGHKIDNVHPNVLRNLCNIIPIFSDELCRELRYELYESLNRRGI